MLHSALNCCRATGTTGPSREQPRCLGGALAVALHLLAAPSQHASVPDSFGSDALPVPQACRPSRVLLVTTGPATKVEQLTRSWPTCTSEDEANCYSLPCVHTSLSLLAIQTFLMLGLPQFGQFGHNLNG